MNVKAEEKYKVWFLNPSNSPVLLPVGDDGEPVCVVPVAADVGVPPGHPCGRRVILLRHQKLPLIRWVQPG